MPRPELGSSLSSSHQPSQPHRFSPSTANFTFFVPAGGLFLDPFLPSSFLNSISLKSNSIQDSGSVSVSVSTPFCHQEHPLLFGVFRSRKNPRIAHCGFLSVSVRGHGFVREQKVHVNAYDNCKKAGECGEDFAIVEKKHTVRTRGAMNTTKHLWSGAIAAMVSRTLVAPLERLKLEYIVRGEQRNLCDLVKKIAASQGLKGFWKGNFVNILRTAPFKAINFYAYDTYRKQLLKLSGHKNTTNFERFVAGAAAGITATVLCLPLDTIRTKIVAPGGEALGGVVGAFRHMIQTEGFFSLYKGLLPSILSVAPSGAVFYSVYDILKTAYLHSPEGRQRIRNMNQQGQGQELNALDQLELGPIRTLLYGAISGACAELVTYPFEVIRKQLQMQVQATRMSAFATCSKIVQQRGIQALYAGLLPSLLQVLPSAAISFFVYEFMKIILKVE
ncbi:hypothetical protein IC582_006424 [Cucumis melo]